MREGTGTLAFVITQRCCDDASCVPVCPVQCIRPRPGDPGFVRTEQLYIDPGTCIDCGACANACPVDAIFPEDKLPSSLKDFTAVNAEYFAENPLREVAHLPVTRRSLTAEQPELRVAVVGAGPSALYAATELSEMVGVSVTIVERTPTPFGLIRSGVAPDHPSTKWIMRRLERVLHRPNVRSLFNVEVGRDISLQEMTDQHHAVVWAGGADGERRLGIPGEHLDGVIDAGRFVRWYNGHPDFAMDRFNLAGRTAVVIGNGNVALDVARVLAQPASAYESSTMSEVALAALHKSSIREVLIVGRRGPVHAAYSTSELLALSTLPDVELTADPAEVLLDPQEAAHAQTLPPASFERRQALVEAASHRAGAGTRRIVLRYRLVPTSFTGEEALDGVVFTRPDGTTERIDTQLVVRAVGFRGRPVSGLPFDESTGIIPNDAGRVLDPATGRPMPGLYCTGWAKRGPSGTIGTNRVDSAETVASLLADLEAGRLRPRPDGQRDLVELVRERHPGVVDLTGWDRIAEWERQRGQAQNRPWAPLLTYDALTRAAHGS
ncbi:FAD-dependent oxidoreductase [Jatrophihabitans sp. YIM 134969]